MSDATGVWRAKTDDELTEAAESLFEFTEEGEQIIRAELARRGLPPPPERVGVCRHCGRSIGPNLPGDVCFQCGNVLPTDILDRIAAAADGIIAADEGTPDGARAGRSVTWEYNTLKLDATGMLGGSFDVAEFEAALNVAGEEGWELVSTFDTNYTQGGTRNVIAVFKRRKS